MDGGQARGNVTAPSLASMAVSNNPSDPTAQQHQPGQVSRTAAGEVRPRSLQAPGNMTVKQKKMEAYRPVSMSLSPPMSEKKRMSRNRPLSTGIQSNQQAYAAAVGELAPDDLPCPSGSGDSHEFVAEWTFWDLVAGCFWCPCHTFSACMCTYLYRDPRKDSFDGAGCKGSGRKTCVKCGQTWEEAEGYLIELKNRATTTWEPSFAPPTEPSKSATDSGTSGGPRRGPVNSKDRLKPLSAD